MPSAYHDQARRRWVADFRHIHAGTGARRRLIVPAERMRPGHESADAQAFALECDRVCRLLEVQVSGAGLSRAIELRILTPAQAVALRDGKPIGEATHRQLGLADAAMAHPSSQRDATIRPADVLVYLRHLEAFEAFTGVRELREVTLDQVMRWVAELRRQGVTWDGRRHRLLYLRRACRMAATRGLPDVLAGLRIDRQELDDRRQVEAWTLPELAKAVVRLEDPRARLAVLLGGVAGLRPSECIRLQVGDLAGDLLTVGARLRKNRSSRRTIPLPASIVAAWKVVSRGRETSAPVFVTAGPRPGPFAASTWGQWLSPLLSDVTGRDLPAKALRKAFATWAPAVIAGRDVERYLGHTPALLAAVTSAHYQAATAAAELRPAAQALERSWRAAVSRFRLPARKSLSHKGW